VEELQQLWKGIPTYDVFKPLGYRSFIQRGVLLWTIHDFPSYGIFAKVAHQGYATCPICGLDFKGEHFVELGKQTYTKTRQWLPKKHPYR